MHNKNKSLFSGLLFTDPKPLPLPPCLVVSPQRNNTGGSLMFRTSERAQRAATVPLCSREEDLDLLHSMWQ